VKKEQRRRGRTLSLTRSTDKLISGSLNFSFSFSFFTNSALTYKKPKYKKEFIIFKIIEI